MAPSDSGSCCSSTSVVARRQRAPVSRYNPYCMSAINQCYSVCSSDQCTSSDGIGRQQGQQQQGQVHPGCKIDWQQQTHDFLDIHRRQSEFQELAITLCEASIADTQQALCSALWCCTATTNLVLLEAAIQQAEAAVARTTHRVQLAVRYMAACKLRRQRAAAGTTAALPQLKYEIDTDDGEEVSSSHKGFLVGSRR